MILYFLLFVLSILFVKAFFIQDIKNCVCTEGDEAGFSCEVITENETVKWIKDDREIKQSSRYDIRHVGKYHYLNIGITNIKDIGLYTVTTNSACRKALLSVKCKKIILNYLNIIYKYTSAK